MSVAIELNEEPRSDRFDVPEAMKRRDPWQLAKLAGLWAAWMVAATVVHALLARGGAATGVAIALGAVTGLLVVAGIGFLGHDIAHGSVVGGERAMRFWTFWSLTVALFVPYFLWIRWHNAFHHRYANTARDSDRLVREEDLRDGVVSYPAYRVMNLLGLSLQYVAVRIWSIVYGKKGLSDRKKRTDLLSLALVLALYGAAAALLPAATFAVGVALPVCVSLVTVSFYIQSNHFGRPQLEKPDPVATSCDVSVPRLMDFCHSNFSCHTAHHVYPSIASRHYPVLTERIRGERPRDYLCVPFLASVWQNLTRPKIVRGGRWLVNRRGEVRAELR